MHVEQLPWQLSSFEKDNFARIVSIVTDFDRINDIKRRELLSEIANDHSELCQNFLNQKSDGEKAKEDLIILYAIFSQHLVKCDDKCCFHRQLSFNSSSNWDSFYNKRCVLDLLEIAQDKGLIAPFFSVACELYNRQASLKLNRVKDNGKISIKVEITPVSTLGLDIVHSLVIDARHYISMMSTILGLGLFFLLTSSEFVVYYIQELVGILVISYYRLFIIGKYLFDCPVIPWERDFGLIDSLKAFSTLILSSFAPWFQ